MSEEQRLDYSPTPPDLRYTPIQPDGYYIDLGQSAGAKPVISGIVGIMAESHQPVLAPDFKIFVQPPVLQGGKTVPSLPAVWNLADPGGPVVVDGSSLLVVPPTAPADGLARPTPQLTTSKVAGYIRIGGNPVWFEAEADASFGFSPVGPFKHDWTWRWDAAEQLTPVRRHVVARQTQAMRTWQAQYWLPNDHALLKHRADLAEPLQLPDLSQGVIEVGNIAFTDRRLWRMDGLSVVSQTAGTPTTELTLPTVEAVLARATTTNSVEAASAFGDRLVTVDWQYLEPQVPAGPNQVVKWPLARLDENLEPTMAIVRKDYWPTLKGHTIRATKWKYLQVEWALSEQGQWAELRSLFLSTKVFETFIMEDQSRGLAPTTVALCQPFTVQCTIVPGTFIGKVSTTLITEVHD